MMKMGKGRGEGEGGEGERKGGRGKGNWGEEWGEGDDGGEADWVEMRGWAW